MNQELLIHVLPLKKAALVLRAINHNLRQHILRLLHEKKERTVSEIILNVGMEQSVVSQHLAILRNAGFVTAQRNGKFIYYSVNYNNLEEVHTYGDQLLEKLKLEKAEA